MIIKYTLSALMLSAAAICSAKAPDAQLVMSVTPRMTCANCVKKIESNIRFEKGVKKVKCDLEKQTITITYDAQKTDSTALFKGVQKIGYQPIVDKK